jgi:hypothetical protein
MGKTESAVDGIHFFGWIHPFIDESTEPVIRKIGSMHIRQPSFEGRGY